MPSSLPPSPQRKARDGFVMCVHVLQYTLERRKRANSSDYDAELCEFLTLSNCTHERFGKTEAEMYK